MQSLDEGLLKLTAVSDLSKITCRNTTEDGCKAIDAELKQLYSDYDDLKLSVQVAKQKIQQKLHDWNDLWKNAKALSIWLQDMELKLSSDQEYGKDLAEKKLLLEQMKVLHTCCDSLNSHKW